MTATVAQVARLGVRVQARAASMVGCPTTSAFLVLTRVPGLGSGRTDRQDQGGLGTGGSGYDDQSTSRRTGGYDNTSSGGIGGTTGGYDDTTSSGRTGGMTGGYDDTTSGGRTGGGYGGTTSSGGYDDTSGSGGKQDSTAGKLMQKAGEMFKNDGLQEKGQAKRAQAGAFGDDATGGGSYGGSGGDSYGQSGQSGQTGGDQYGSSTGQRDNY